MAEKPIRVLWRVTLGQPYRHAAADEKQRANESLTATLKKWKAAGVRLLGSWMAPGGDLDGYCHYLILEMKDLEQLSQFNREFFDTSEYARLIAEYSMAVGDINQPWEKWWADA
jgi:hypothetical protein